MSDEAAGRERIFKDIAEYCEEYNIPIENLLEILEDQKVLPMIRGKATEYIGAAILRKSLDSREWLVEKLNINAQPDSHDEDISITFRRTGTRLKVETKNAVRGGFKMGGRIVQQPHFAVKCHRSRSHLTRDRNDRYHMDDFHVLISNVSNAIFVGRSLSRGLPFIKNAESIAWLKQFYKINTDEELRRAVYDDWRVCFPRAIAQEDKSLPRTPKVLMDGDPHWFKVEELEARLQNHIEHFV